MAGATGLLVVLVVALFRGRRPRVLAAVALVPLPLVVAAVLFAGTRGPGEAQDLQQGSSETGAEHLHMAQRTAPPSAASGGEVDLEALLRAARALPGMEWPDPGQAYTRETLWDRIDGGAEIYRKHGMRAALFATARRGDGDLEVQLFDLRTAANAAQHLDEVTRGAPVTPLPAVGDRAVLWRGGGELIVGPIYVRVVLSTASEAPEVVAAPEAVLRAVAGAAASAPPPPAGARPTVPSTPSPPARPVAPATPPARPPTALAPPPARPAAVDPGADPALLRAIGLTAEEAGRYGVVGIRGDAALRTVEVRDPFLAAALVGHLARPGAEALGRFGFHTSEDAVLARGALVLLAHGPDAVARARAAAGAVPDVPLPGVAALQGADEVEARLDGWSGRAFLGRTLIARWEDGTEVFVAEPHDAEAIFRRLLATWEGAPAADGQGVTAVRDPYQGEVLVARRGSRVCGILGFPNPAEGRRRLAAILAP